MNVETIRSEVRRCLFTVIFVGCAVCGSRIVLVANDRMNEFCPPYGTRMPPDEFTVHHSQKARVSNRSDFPVTYSSYRSSNGKGISLEMARRNLARPDPISVNWSWMWNIPDGHLAMISGQLYRCDSTAMVFRRIPNHPLNIEPKDAINLFAVPSSAGLSIRMLDSRQRFNPSIGLISAEFDAENRTLNSPGRARLLVGLSDGEIAHLVNPAGKTQQERIRIETVPHELLGPVPLPSASFDSVWVRAGQYIETTFFYLKVTRIVFPDPAQGIDGWVEVRVIADRPPGNRAPAPHLPEE